MKTRKPTGEQLRDDYVVKGMSTHLIGKKWGCSKGWVHWALVKYNIPRRAKGRPRNLKPTDRKSIMTMRRSGYSIHWIADMLGINFNHVWRTLKAEGMVGSKSRPARYGARAAFKDAEPMVG